MHESNGNGTKPKAKNVLGGELQTCCTAPMTGFYRNGRCDTGVEDRGVHTVCVEVTAEFLEFSASSGNDLSSPAPGFPGLKPKDKWCLCAARWKEALDAGVAPKVILESTHAATLRYVSLDDLKGYATDG
ncbi:MAG: DUF2237 domain-containing protein [Pyrinomonadaceae bacterium MAG19_C2-C3]|nr:DUF2237 domain-containing protein [Pyrinomonadaceae bacterium MAG19_C2-C3]